MKKFILLASFTLLSMYASGQNRFWISTISSNWNNTANWSAVSGGAGGASVPGAGNVAIFNGVGGRNGNCLLDIAPTVGGITVNGYTGIIDLVGSNLTTSGANTFTSGTIINSGVAAALTLSASTTTTFNGTAFTADVSGTTGNILFNGSTFGGIVNVTKTNNSNDNGTGNNTFNGAVTLTNTSTSQLLLGSANKDIFNNTLTLNINNTGAIAIASGGATTHQLNGNVSINYNSTGAVFFGTNNGPSSLAAGKTLTVASFGVSGCGNLLLSHVTTSATSQTISLAGNTTATLTLGPASVFNGNLTASAPSVIPNASTFVGTTVLTKTGTVDDNIHGGNLFSGPLTVNNTSDNDMYFGHFAAEAGDTYNGTSIWNALGGGRIRIPEYTSGSVFNAAATFNSSGANNINNRIQVSRFAGSAVTFNNTAVFINNGNSSDVEIAYDPGSTATFNGPVTFNSSTSVAGAYYIGFDGSVTLNNNVTVTSTCGDNIQFGANNGSATLNAGFTVSAGSFALGQLSFQNFTQTGGTAQSLTLTGTALLQLGPTAKFGGNVNFVSPQVLINGTTFSGTAYIEKNGAGNNASTGGNTFGGATSLVASGSGQFILANTSPDTFNGDLTISNSGSNIIYMAHNVAGTAFNGNIIVNSTGSSGGIFFSNNATGSSTQAIGKNISVGGSGFSSGELRIKRFTQNGSAANNLTLTGTCILRVGPTTTFGGNVNFVSPQVYLDGGTYSGMAYIEKNGASNNFGNGGNTFATTATLVNSGSGFFYTANVSADTFNGDLTLTNTGSASIHMSETAVGNQFNGNIIVNSTLGTGIFFAAGTGSSTLASGKTISIGASGFSSGGTLGLYRFTQLGSAAVNLTLTAGSILRSGPATTWGGNVNFVAPQIYLDGATYNGTAYIEKNGAVDNAGLGANTFSGTASLVDSGSGYLLTANTSPDTFTGDLTVTNSGSNIIYLAHNVPGTAFNGNIIVNSISGGGIYLSNNVTGTSTMAATKTISVGGSGFSVGELRIKRFTQNGTQPMNLTLTGVAILRAGPTSSFGGNVNFISPQVYLDGATYNGTAYIEKNGPTDNAGNGGNTFVGTTSLVESGSGYLMTGNVSADTFNGDLTLTNSGSNIIYLSNNSAGNAFNGNITVNSTSGNGIYFSNNAAATSVLASTKSISIGGLNFLSGELRLARFTQLGSTPTTPLQNLLLGGASSLRIGPASTFNADVTFKAPQLYLDGCNYNGITYLEKNGATGNGGIGNNIFATTTTIVNSGSNFLRTNGSNTFNGTTTLSDSGSGDILLENITGSTYNGDVTLTNTGSSYIRAAFTGATAFNGNIITNSTNGTGVYFCEAAAGTATLANTKTITVGGTGFTVGQLRIQRFTQVGNTPQVLLLSGSGVLGVGPTATFNGNVDFRAPQVFLDGGTYNGTVYLEKTGAANNTGVGSNFFASTATIVNSGSGAFRTNGSNTFNGTTLISDSGSSDILLENVTGSTYNGDVTFTNTGTANVRVAFLGATSFNGNITVNNTAGLGIYFCESVGATATLANTKSIVTGVSGFTTGLLLLQRFTQVGIGAQTLTLTGSSSLQIGPLSTFNGNVNFKAPQVFLNGCTYNGITLIEKTGATNNDSNGNNIFNGVTTITNSGSGWLRTARTALDQFNNDLTLTNTGISTIYMSDLIAGSLYNGNITVNCTLGTGIYFGNNNGSSTLATGKAISVGASGFSIGELRLQNFTQIGATNQTVALTGLADLRLGPVSTFNGNVDFRAPQMYIDGITCNGTAYLEKNGAGNNVGLGNSTFASTTSIVNTNSGQFRTNGNNFFNGTTTILNSGTNDVLLELNAGSTYNGDVTMTNTGSSYVRAAYIGSNFFNGNIIVNSLNATGVFFCENALGTATLATGKTISVGATGFSAGELRIQRFTQVGPAAQSLILTGAAIITTGPTTVWNGNFSVSSPIIFLNGTTFNGVTNSITKTGTSTDPSVGGNTFNGAVTITNGGTGIFRLANTTGDTFNGSASFAQPSGTLQPAYAGASISTSDINTNSATPVIFGVNAGTLTLSGAGPQTISKSGVASPTFNRLIMSKSGSLVTLSTDINIAVTTTFTTGVISSSATNFINFAAGSTATGASNASYVDGPVRKTGNTAFTFPTGNGGVYRSIAISAPTTNTHVFTAQYFKAAQAFGGPATYTAPLVTVSSCEYWTLDRTVGGSNVSVTLSWNSPDCTGPYIGDITKLRVARWSATKWVDQGNGGTTGNTTTGTVVSSAAVTTFIASDPFTLASTSYINPLPIELMSFTATPMDTKVQLDWVTASELNNDYFTLERSTDGTEFSSLTTVKGAGTKHEASRYEYVDENPAARKMYYRLAQTDYDRVSTHSDIIVVDLDEITQLTLYPNPVQRGGTVTLNYQGNYILYNSLGIEVMRIENAQKINITSLSAGLYIVKTDKGLLQRLVVE